ncbi:DASH complex subunit ask1, partial [Linderina pennispora]
LVSGRFTNALSQALKHDEFTRPPLPPHTIASAQQPRQYSPEEELEEIEQKITLTLQEIDANFDRCQRTMARDVMPKIEQMAKLSSELLEASHPWLQFFMSVASAEDQSDESFVRNVQAPEDEPYSHSMGAEDTTRFGDMGPTQRATIEEQAGRGEITAQFPDKPMQLVIIDSDEEAADSDADTEIASPQTPRTGATKRIADQLSTSAKKRRRSRRIAPPRQPGNSAGKEVAFEEDGDDDDEENEEEMLEEINTLLHRYESPRPANDAAQSVSEESPAQERIPDSAKSLPLSSVKSMSSSSVIPVPASATKSPVVSENGEDDDDIDMQALAAKYASPQSAVRSESAHETGTGVPGPHGNAEAMDIDSADEDVHMEDIDADESLISPPPQIRTTLIPLAAGSQPSVNGSAASTTAATATTAKALRRSQSQDMTARPVSQAISSRPRPQSQNAMTRPQAQNAATRPRSQDAIARPAVPNGRTWQFGRHSLVSTDMQQADTDDISPLANRGSRQQPSTRIASSHAVQPTTSYTERFQPLGMADGEDDPFGPSPVRTGLPRRPQPVRSAPRQPDRPASAQSETAAGLRTERRRPQSAATVNASFTSRSDTLMGSDVTTTILSPNLDLNDTDHHGLHANTTDSQLNESSMSLENQDYTGSGLTNMDGTTTILPTREMLQQAARQARDSEAQNTNGLEEVSVLGGDDDDVTQTSFVSMASNTEAAV